MIVNYDLAATSAAQILIENRICSAPIDPIPILKRMPHFNVLTFTEMSSLIGVDRKSFLSSFSAENHDAFTTVLVKDNKKHYIVSYNMRLPQYIIQRALARELGHIVLGHDGTRPEEVREAEALTFAHHLLCPRALIHAIQESGTRITTEVLGNTTGCYERCLLGMRRTPETHVPAELNRRIKEQFADYLSDFLDFQTYLSRDDESSIADFGTFMDGYEE